MAEEEKVKAELKAEGTLTVETKHIYCQTCLNRLEAGEIPNYGGIVELTDDPMKCMMSDCPERDAILYPEETEAPTPPKAEKQIYEKGMEGDHIAELFPV